MEAALTKPSDAPRSETFEADGHVITIGCRFLAEAQKWEPTASVRPSWEPGSDVAIAAKIDEYQDSPEDAIGVARGMVTAWLLAKDPNGVATG